MRGFSERAGPRLRQTSLSNLSLESWQRAPGRGLGGPRSRTGRKQRNLLGAGRPLEEALGSTVESSPPSPRELWRKIQGCPGPGACHATPPGVQPGHWGQDTGPGPAQEHGPAGPKPQEQGRAWGFCFAPFRGVSKRRQRPSKGGLLPTAGQGPSQCLGHRAPLGGALAGILVNKGGRISAHDQVCHLRPLSCLCHLECGVLSSENAPPSALQAPAQGVGPPHCWLQQALGMVRQAPQ